MWDVATGDRVRTLDGHTALVRAAAFSPDGRVVATGGHDQTVRLWNVATGREVRRIEGLGDEVLELRYSPDGRRLLGGLADTSARLWDPSIGEEIHRLEGKADPLRSVVLAKDGESALIGGCGLSPRLWSLREGRPVRRLPVEEESGRFGNFSPDALAFSSDGRTAVTGGRSGEVVIHDLVTGRPRRLEGHARPIRCAAFSPDGEWVLSGSEDGSVRLGEVATGAGRLLGRHEKAVYAVFFTPDGRETVSVARETVLIHDAATGREIGRIETGEDDTVGAALAPDGRSLLLGGVGPEARLRDLATGEARKLGGHTDFLLCVAFLDGGRRALTGSYDRTMRLWDVATGEVIRRFDGHPDAVASIAVSPDERWAMTGCLDQKARIWDLGTGALLCTLVSFRDGGWAVVDPAGRYDASGGGDVDGLHWVIGDETISLDQLKERYYEPGLLPRILGLREERPRDVEAFDPAELFPEVALAPPTGETLRLDVRLENRGGGIGRVVVRVNGKERTADARSPDHDPGAERVRIGVDLAGDPRLIPGRENTVEVLAYNAEGYLRSRGVSVRFTPSGEASKASPRLWAVVAGISDYEGDAIDLRYAAKDARDFARALTTAAARLLGPDRVRVTTLTTGSPNRPTRDALLAALDAAKASRPVDILVVYVAGHGVSRGGRDGDFHLLAAEARSASLEDPAVRRRVAISSRELTERIKAIPALKQVLILDTCASGRLVEKLTERREVPGSQVRALERLKDRTGLFVLAGCASDRVSYEATRYAQGLLTHSLLLGMKGAALRAGEFVDVATLFGFAADEVPRLAKDVGGIQRPILASPRAGASFDLGQLTPADRERVPLQSARPLLLQSNFQDEDEFADTLDLARRVDRLLRDETSRGADAAWVFVDTRAFPCAYRIVGRYDVEEGEVRLGLRLFLGKERVGAAEVRGSSAEPDALAARAVAAGRKLIVSSRR